MKDITWLTKEATQLHDMFYGWFFILASTMLLIGIMVEYFRLPVGGQANFTRIIGRVLVATMILVAYPEIINKVADLSDAIVNKIGGMNKINEIQALASKSVKEKSWSYTDMDETFIWLLSYLVYAVLYYTVFIYDAIIVYGWTVSYIFSPILILMYIFPATSTATTMLFRTHFELASYKIVWSVLGTLLWSTALEHLSASGSDEKSSLVVAGYLIIVAFSMVFTRKVVQSLVNSGMAGMASSMGAVASASLTAGMIGRNGLSKVMRAPVTVPLTGGYNFTKKLARNAKKKVQKNNFSKRRKPKKTVYESKRIRPLNESY